MAPLLLSLCLSAQAADTPASLFLVQAAPSVGMGPRSGALSAAGGWSISGGMRLGPEPRRAIGLDLRLRELVASAEPRVVSTIDFDLRWPGGPGPYLDLGFSHHHEVGLDLYQQNPVAATLATLPGIVHRTGLNVGGGWLLPSPWKELDPAHRLHPSVHLGGTWLPASAGPPVYGFVELGLAMELGPRP